MMVSISFAVEIPSLIIVLMASVHATNLLLGRRNRSLQKSMSHPRITFCFSRRASDFNLFLAYVVSPGMMALISCDGHEHVSKARGGRNRIGQDYLSPLCPLSRRWGCPQCNCQSCLVDQSWCQQSTRGCPWMGSYHSEILDNEQDVGSTKQHHGIPICCSVLSWWWGRRRSGGSTKGEAKAHQYTIHHSQTNNICNKQCPPKITSFYADLNVTDKVGKPPIFCSVGLIKHVSLHLLTLFREFWTEEYQATNIVVLHHGLIGLSCNV